MAVFYLDVDDEITTAASRIRSSADVDVALVLPAGSRIATSRINFRLLAGEASGRSRRLAIVAPEASTRALASSAGLPVFGSVGEYEEARSADEAGGAGATGAAGATPDVPAVAGPPGEEGPRHPPPAAGGIAIGTAGVAAARAGAHARPLAPADAARPLPTPDAAAETKVGGAPRVASSVASSTGSSESAVSPRQRAALGASTGLGAAPPVAVARGRRWPLLIALLVGVLLLGGAGVAVAYVLLPTATVTVQLTSEPVGPVSFIGTADPDAVAVDAASATIPAVRVPVALSASGTFDATGKRVEEAAATGSVEWENCDNSRAYTIPAGTVVRTGAGIGFATQEGILLPVAIITGTPPDLGLTCARRSVGVTAVRAGEAGNVEAGAIRVVPGAFDSRLVRVRNPAPTSGGMHDEFPLVTEKDVAAAVAGLTKELDAQLAAIAPDPPGTPPGAIAYPETALRGEPVPSEPVADVVGREAETFDLTLTADATVVAADPAPLEAIAVARVAAEVPEGMQLREGSTRVTVGDGIAEGQVIRYPVEAEAEAVQEISEEEVRALVKGRTPAEAEALLAEYGTVEVTLWPDWASTITTVDARLAVTVEGVPPAEATPAPTPRPTPAPTPLPSPSSLSTAPPSAAP